MLVVTEADPIGYANTNFIFNCLDPHLLFIVIHLCKLIESIYRYYIAKVMHPSRVSKVLHPCKLIIYSPSHWICAFTHSGRRVLLYFTLLVRTAIKITMNTSKHLQYVWLFICSHVFGLSRFFFVSAFFLLFQFTQLYSNSRLLCTLYEKYYTFLAFKKQV